MPKSTRPDLTPIFLTVVLDAVGIGLVLPVLPDLFGATAGAGSAGLAYGAFLSLYALMQFLFAPVLGGLSDRVGRKPVLIASIAGAMVNYAAMALLPPLWVLFVLRAIAGVTGASLSVAQAYLADLSTAEDRAERFGQLSACFGVGFILGPVAGGLLRGLGLNWPFAVAAVVTGLNLVLCLARLPESRAMEPAATLSEDPFDPFAGLREIGHFRGLAPLLMASGLFALTGEVGGSVWVFYTHQKFHWQGMMVGISLGLFGLFHSLVQAFLIGPATRRLGDRGALLAGVACDVVSYVALALLGNGLFVFALIPVLCVAGMGPSVLAAVISRKVDEDRQGQLQGVIASLASLASIIGPTLFLSLYFATCTVFPGLVWIAGASLYLICLPVILRRSTYGFQTKVAAAPAGKV